MVIFLENGKQGIRNEEVLVPAEYDNIMFYTDIGFMLFKDGKYGFYSFKKHFISPEYDNIKVIPLDNEYIVIGVRNRLETVYYNGQAILLDIAGGIKTEKNFIKFYIDEKYCLVDITGKKVLPATYHSIEVFDEYIIVRNEEKKGAFDFNGKELLKIKYKNIYRVKKDFFVVYDTTYKLLDKNKKIIDEGDGFTASDDGIILTKVSSVKYDFSCNPVPITEEEKEEGKEMLESIIRWR